MAQVTKSSGRVARPLGMNLRNFLIRNVNPFDALSLAKDKAQTKDMLHKNGFLVPKTYLRIDDFNQIDALKNIKESEFVVKPNRGLGGIGIIVFKKQGELYFDPASKPYTFEEIKIHIRKILDGEFSSAAEGDSALIEERIYPSKKLKFKDAIGLPDVRIFCVNYEPMMAMIRYSTAQSRGKANLSSGAIGMAIDMASGAITNVRSKKEKREFKPEDFNIPVNFTVPKWEEMKAAAKKACGLAGLKICGADIILDHQDRVMILELNGRPGLEIQNINGKTLLESTAGL